MPEFDVEELKQVAEQSGHDTSGETNLRADKSLVESVKAELGISQNTQLVPLLESKLAEIVDDEETAQEKLEEYKNQFNDDDE